MFALDEKTSVSSCPFQYLGPALVKQVINNRILLENQGKRVWGSTALAFPYQFHLDDSVLVIGQDDNWYVIGVLKGKGATVFTAPGDLKFSAPKGVINFSSSRAIRVRSPEVKILSDNLEFISKTIVEKAENIRRWVRESIQVRADRIRSVVESTYHLKARRIKERAREEVKIDGKKIHLG